MDTWTDTHDDSIMLPKTFVLHRYKKIADHNSEFVENGGNFSKRVENNVGKGEIDHYKTCLLQMGNKPGLLWTRTHPSTQKNFSALKILLPAFFHFFTVFSEAFLLMAVTTKLIHYQVSLCLQCYERPLFQAWLLPDLNTIPYNCVRENSL